MPLELKKISPVELRSVGLNEKWLQDQIKADTTILGLGELDIIGKEHKQQPGGRIDFLMHHADTDLFYEVEIMLGTLDESHIIRTIEYWEWSGKGGRNPITAPSLLQRTSQAASSTFSDYSIVPSP